MHTVFRDLKEEVRCKMDFPPNSPKYSFYILCLDSLPEPTTFLGPWRVGLDKMCSNICLMLFFILYKALASRISGLNQARAHDGSLRARPGSAQTERVWAHVGSGWIL